ncbi:hypothetical protein AFK69_15205, partial [Xenorhabdus sp. GDc328]|uniref:hypothetical protein n=1 Tax=Xenorhabdus sp. GDc328 TaxID=742178 RepID=UPI0006BF8493
SKENESRDKFYSRIGYLDLVISPQNIIKLCEAVEKLAEYENITPIAWTSEEEIIKMRETGTHLEGYPIPFKNNHTIAIYRHPNK